MNSLTLLIKVFFILFFCSKSFSSETYCGCNPKEVACIKICYKKSPIYRDEYWPDWSALDLNSRVSLADKNVVNWLNMSSIIRGKTPMAKVSTNQDMLSAVSLAIQTLPKEVINLVEKTVAGVVLVEGLNANGRAEVTFQKNMPVEFSKDSKVSRTFLLLDADNLNIEANEWATNYENRFFKGEGSKYSLQVELANKYNNDRVSTIQKVLIHEMGHALGIIKKLHPFPWQAGSQIEFSSSEFMRLFWKKSASQGIVPKEDIIIPYLKKLRKKSMQRSEMLKFYEDREQTSFPTNYSLSRWNEDFADSFAYYVWTVLMGNQYNVNIYKDGIFQKSFPSCWKEKRCQKRFLYFNQLFSKNNNCRNQ